MEKKAQHNVIIARAVFIHEIRAISRPDGLSALAITKRNNVINDTKNRTVVFIVMPPKFQELPQVPENFRQK